MWISGREGAVFWIMIFADVAFPVAVRAVFTYAVPDALAHIIQPGVRVAVPFQQRETTGLVVEVHQRKPAFTFKQILEVVDPRPVLHQALLETAGWMSRFYYCGPGEALEAMLPAGITPGRELMIKPAENTSLPEVEPWPEVTSCLAGGPVAAAELLEIAGVSAGWINRQIKNGLLERFFVAESVIPVPKYERWKATGRFSSEAVIQELRSTKKIPKWAAGALEIFDKQLLPETPARLHALGIEQPAIQRLLKLQFIEKETFEPDFKVPDDAESRLNPLNEEQKKAFDHISAALNEGAFASFLLNGITGSGKTEVYLHAMLQSIKSGRPAILLIPEIALTPQTVRRFKHVFGDSIAVLHSRLSPRERRIDWDHVRNGRKKIVIGARSAIFAPVHNPGIIIIDEEHDPSFKQADPAPRYHAREVAHIRARYENTVVVCGSATPSLASLESVRQGKVVQLNLESRHGTAKLPPVTLLPMKHYRQSGMHGPLAAPLFLAAERALGRGEQVILLLNRRGYSPYLECETCADVPACPHCSVSLTFHKQDGQLRCHYCGYSVFSDGLKCKSCGTGGFAPVGQGTQQIEESLLKLFPGVKTIRFDLDTTGGRHSHDELLGAFARKEAQLLIGTQLVAKGHDFPDVTVVGVLNPDAMLAFPSYRSSERLFTMLAQVAGRAGRAEKPGQVFIQTNKPELDLYQCVAKHNTRLFAELEMQQREAMFYPPFSRLLKIECKDRKEPRAARAAATLVRLAQQISPGTPVLGPSPGLPAKRADFFYWDLLIKLPPSAGAHHIESFLDAVFEAYKQNPPSDCSSTTIIPVIDPQN